MAKKTPEKNETPAEKLQARGIDALCELIMDGAMMAQVAREVGVSQGSLIAWIAADPDRSARAREARQATAQMWEEKAEEQIMSAVDPFQLAKAKELAHHYRWRASKIAPKLYGDKVELLGNKDAPLTVVVQNLTANPDA